MKFKFDISGLKKLEQKVNKLENLKYSDFITSSFLQRCSNFSSFDELLDNSGLNIRTQQQFDVRPRKEFDEYIRKVTFYNSFYDLEKAAYSEFIKKL